MFCSPSDALYLIQWSKDWPRSGLRSCRHVTRSSRDSLAIYASRDETVFCLAQTPLCRLPRSLSLLELAPLPAVTTTTNYSRHRQQMSNHITATNAVNNNIHTKTKIKYSRAFQGPKLLARNTNFYHRTNWNMHLTAANRYTTTNTVTTNSSYWILGQKLTRTAQPATYSKHLRRWHCISKCYFQRSLLKIYNF